MRRHLTILFAIALGVAASPAVAETADSAQMFERDVYEPKQRHTREVYDRYARCLALVDGPTIRRMLLGDPNSGAFERWRKNLRATCMIDRRGDSYYVNPDNVTLRFSLADVLVSRELKRAVPSNLAAIPPLTHPNERVSGVWFARISRFGECVVRRNPASVVALLKTRIASKEEQAAFEAVLPGARPCLDRQLEIHPISLRGTLALNYLRLVHAARRSASVGASR